MSDILSRGVGKGRNRDSTPAETNGSPGMGTFGVEASQDPVSSSEVSSVSLLGRPCLKTGVTSSPTKISLQDPEDRS